MIALINNKLVIDDDEYDSDDLKKMLKKEVKTKLSSLSSE